MEYHGLSYAWEQLYSSVSSLACDPSPLRERLYNAVSSRTNRIFPTTSTDESDALPPEISERLRNLEQTLTKKGSYRETIDLMEDREVKQTIEEIVSLFNTVARAYPEL